MASVQAVTRSRRRVLSRDEWQAHALQLAEAQHLTGTARILAEDVYRIVYGVRKSGPVGEYVVLVTPTLCEVVCDCIAGTHRRPCSHAGAALHAFRQRLAAIAHPDTDPLANWRRDMDW